MQETGVIEYGFPLPFKSHQKPVLKHHVKDHKILKKNVPEVLIKKPKQPKTKYFIFILLSENYFTENTQQQSYISLKQSTAYTKLTM